MGFGKINKPPFPSFDDFGKMACARSIFRRDAPPELVEKFRFVMNSDPHLDKEQFATVEYGASLMWQLLNDPEFFKHFKPQENG